MTLTWVYDLPFGKGKRWMSSAPKPANAVLGGWSVQGFNTVMSGEPYSISSGAKTNNFDANSFAVIRGNTMPDSSLKSVPGVLGPVAFTNASGFAIPAPGAYGEGRVQWSVVLGHGRICF
jgi:hypothetical protein